MRYPKDAEKIMNGARSVVLLALATMSMLGEAILDAQDVPQQLHSYVGQKLILRSYGNDQVVTVKRTDLNRGKGTCDKAVEVLNVTGDKDKAVFQLEQIGEIQAGGSSVCPRSWAQTTLTITDVGDTSSQAFQSELQDLLLTPEAYLARIGHPFDHQPSEDLGPVTRPGGGVTPPRPVLQISPEFSEQARKERIEDSRASVEIVIGPDGRIHSSRILKGPGHGLDEQALRVLSLWRFEPARQGDKPVAVRLSMEFSFYLH
jgi:TonB family protein